MSGWPKCPKCEKGIEDFVVRHAVVGARSATGPGFHGAAICCPHCMVIISLVAEPNAIAADVVRRLRIGPATAHRRLTRQGGPAPSPPEEKPAHKC
jgi:hypothetical protein